MTATAVRKRRRSSKVKDIVGKEAWQVVGPRGVMYETGNGPDVTLVHAQRLAQEEPGEVTLTVRLMPLFGEPDTHFTVVRDEDGAVLTYR
jgi:hypothetical protein